MCPLGFLDCPMELTSPQIENEVAFNTLCSPLNESPFENVTLAVQTLGSLIQSREGARVGLAHFQGARGRARRTHLGRKRARTWKRVSFHAPASRITQPGSIEKQPLPVYDAAR